MPWQEARGMDLRREAISLTQSDGVAMRKRPRRCGVSPKTGYEWLARSVYGTGQITVHGHELCLSGVLLGKLVAARPTAPDGVHDVYDGGIAGAPST